MDTAITVIHILLIIFSTVAGFGKLIVPYTRLAKVGAWVNDFKPEQIRLISVLEAGAAVGLAVSLFLPSLTMVTTLAAVGVALVMAGAIATHLRRSEYPNIIGNLVWLGLALFLAYGKLVGFAV